jgi:hypothetical protein
LRCNPRLLSPFSSSQRQRNDPAANAPGAAPALFDAADVPAVPGQHIDPGENEGIKRNERGRQGARLSGDESESLEGSSDTEYYDFDLDEAERQWEAQVKYKQKKNEEIAALALRFANDIKEHHINELIMTLRSRSLKSDRLRLLISSCPCLDERKSRALDGMDKLMSGGVESDSGDKVRWLADVFDMFAGVKLLEETAEAEARGQTRQSEAKILKLEQTFVWASEMPRGTTEKIMFCDCSDRTDTIQCC